MSLFVDDGQPEVAELGAGLDESADPDNDSGLCSGDPPSALSAPAEEPRPQPPIRLSPASLQLMGPWATFAEALKVWETLPENLKFPPAARVLPETGFVRLRQVLHVIPVGKTSWYAGVKSGRFPSPVPLSERAMGYRVEHIRGLIALLSAQNLGPSSKGGA